MKRTLPIAIIAVIIVATAALYRPGNAAIPLVQAAEGPFKVRPDPKRYDVPLKGYVLDQLAIPYIKDKKIRDDYAKTYWCGTPTAQYLKNNPAPDPTFLKMHAETLIARYRQD